MMRKKTKNDSHADGNAVRDLSVYKRSWVFKDVGVDLDPKVDRSGVDGHNIVGTFESICCEGVPTSVHL